MSVRLSHALHRGFASICRPSSSRSGCCTLPCLRRDAIPFRRWRPTSSSPSIKDTLFGPLRPRDPRKGMVVVRVPAWFRVQLRSPLACSETQHLGAELRFCGSALHRDKPERPGRKRTPDAVRSWRALGCVSRSLCTLHASPNGLKYCDGDVRATQHLWLSQFVLSFKTRHPLSDRSCEEPRAACDRTDSEPRGVDERARAMRSIGALCG